MSSPEQVESAGDRLKLVQGESLFDQSATAWLIGQGVRYLNMADKKAEFTYKHIIELLQDKKDAVQMIIELSKAIPRQDFPLRWSLLHILGNFGDRTAAEFLSDLSLKKLPERKEGEGCEGPIDGEILVRTMAIEALQQIATRDSDVSEYILKIVSEHPSKPLLIEAVKAAVALGLNKEVTKILPKDDHWILDIRIVPPEKIQADPERDDDTKYGFEPPKEAALSTSPKGPCCRKEE